MLLSEVIKLDQDTTFIAEMKELINEESYRVPEGMTRQQHREWLKTLVESFEEVE